MPVSKNTKATKVQRAWMESYEQATGFEVMRQEDLDGTKGKFEEIACNNIKWYETHTVGIHLQIGNELQSILNSGRMPK